MTSLKKIDEGPVRSVVLNGYGGYDKIVVQEGPRPKSPDRGQVLVKVRACGLNFCDQLTRQGIYTFQNIRPPFVMGIECAGIIEEIPDDVLNLKVGDRVMCWSFNYGLWTEIARVPAENCMIIPDSMTFEEAACIPIQYLTAYLALMDFGNLRSNQSVLIQAVAGGVGWAATQIAKSVGKVTIFGTASESKHKVVEENGVHHVIDYRNKDFIQEVKKISPNGVDVILDCLSGSDMIKSIDLLNQMGRIITIGVSSMLTGEKRNFLRNFLVWWQTKNVSTYNLIRSNRSVCGLNISTLLEKDPQRFRNGLTAVLKMYEEGKIKPKIDSIFSFEEVVNAAKRIVERQNVGKVILVPRKEEEETQN